MNYETRQRAEYMSNYRLNEVDQNECFNFLRFMDHQGKLVESSPSIPEIVLQEEDDMIRALNISQQKLATENNKLVMSVGTVVQDVSNLDNNVRYEHNIPSVIKEK